MDSTIEKLKVLIIAETEQFQKAIKNVKTSVSNLSSNVSKENKKMSNSFSTATRKIKTSFNSIRKIATTVLSGLGLIQLGKSALDMASDVEEVQNVVDVAFGDMASQAEYFANKVARAFGLSSLVAKQYSSQLMAMANSMGIATAYGKTMSLQITALAGDLASFYNTSTDDAFVALQGIYTGMVRPLRRYGVTLSEATLEEYRLAKGIKTKYSNMSEAAKVALRYNYVMEATAQSQGDFARTSGSWANQIRLLSLQWKSLLVIVGDFLRQILLPMVTVLNTILQLLQRITTEMGAMFGLKKTESEMSNISSSAEDIAAGFDDATESADDLRSVIAGFDELYKLSDNDSSSSNGANIDFPLVEPYEWESYLNIELMNQSFDELLTKFNGFLEKTNDKFEEFKEKFVSIGHSIGESFNHLFDSIKWDELGEAVGHGITIIYDTMNEFFETVDWASIGHNIYEFLDSAINNTDFTAIGENFALKLNALFAVVKETIGNPQLWEDATTALINAINGFIDRITVDDIAETIATVVNNIWKTFKRLLTEIDWLDLAKTIIDGLKTALSEVDTEVIVVVGVALGVKFVKGIASGILSVGKSILGSTLAQIVGAQLLLDPINVFISHLQNNWRALDYEAKHGALTLTKTLNGLTGSFEGQEQFIIGWKGVIVNGFYDIGKKAKSVLGEIGKSAEGVLSTFGKFAGIAALIAAVVAALIEAYNTNETFRESVDNLFNAIKGVFTTIKEKFSELWEVIKPGVEKIIELIKKVWDIFVELVAIVFGCIADDLTPLIEGLVDIIANAIETIINIVEPFINILIAEIDLVLNTIDNLGQFIKHVFAGDWEAAWEDIKNIFLDVWDTFVTVCSTITDFLMENIVQPIINTGEAIWEFIAGLLNKIMGGIETAVNWCVDKLNGLIELINKAISAAGDIVGKDWNGISIIQDVQLPKLAKGGVFESAATVMVGEKSNASNPEIVAPQETMRTVFESVMVDNLSNVIAAIERNTQVTQDKETNIEMDGIKLTKQITKNQKNLSKYGSSSLVNI